MHHVLSVVHVWLSEHKLGVKETLVLNTSAFSKEAGLVGLLCDVRVNQEHLEEIIFKVSESLIITKLL